VEGGPLDHISHRGGPARGLQGVHPANPAGLQ
jgi:hypothetical protein